MDNLYAFAVQNWDVFERILSVLVVNLKREVERVQSPASVCSSSATLTDTYIIRQVVDELVNSLRKDCVLARRVGEFASNTLRYFYWKLVNCPLIYEFYFQVWTRKGICLLGVSHAGNELANIL